MKLKYLQMLYDEEHLKNQCEFIMWKLAALTDVLVSAVQTKHTTHKFW